MKNSMKNIFILVCLSWSITSFANEKTTVLLSESKGGNYTVDFLNENKVTAMQFDIVLDSNNFNKAMVGSCETFLPKSHVGSCKVMGNKLRVVIFSTKNSILESGKIGEFKLNNYKQKLTIENVEFVKPNASIIQGEVLVDRFNNKFLKNKSLK